MRGCWPTRWPRSPTATAPVSLIVATQLLAVTRIVSAQAVRRLPAGEPWSEIAADARERAEQAFALLENGVGNYSLT